MCLQPTEGLAPDVHALLLWGGQ